MIRRSILRLGRISAAAALAGGGLAALTAPEDWTPQALAAEEDCAPDAGFTHCVEFTFEGTDQTFTVPDDVASLNAELLGAGGGSSAEAPPGGGTQQGGAGGTTTGTVPVTPGQLTVTVGGGGEPGSGSSAGGFGGGGDGGNATRSGGGGGGMSALWDGAANEVANVLLIAGGGGGAPGGSSQAGAAGGVGGGTEGGAGTISASGGGGTQTEGGDRGFPGPGGTNCTSPPQVGAQFQGGNAAFGGDSDAGGGGGGGWFGGGGGDCTTGFGIGDGGGGGGSGRVNTDAGLTGTTTQGGGGAGGTNQTPGENGSVRLQWVGPADLEESKTVDNTTPLFGDDIVFTLEVTNNGPNDAFGVTVTDELPDGLTFVSADGDGAYDDATGIWDVGELPNGETATIDITGTVETTEEFENVITESGSDGVDPAPCPDDCGDGPGPTTPIPVSDLEETKTVDNDTPEFGDDIVYTLEVTNNGPNDATGVTVTDELPDGLTFVSADGDGTYDDGTGIWDIGDLANGATATIDVTVTVETTEEFENAITDSGLDGEDPTPCPDDCGESPDPIEPTYADLETTKDVEPAVVAIGDEFTFVITVTNTGNTDTTGVEVVDDLPEGLTYLSDDSGGDYDPDSGVWSVGDLAVDETRELRLEVLAEGDATNEIQSATSDITDPTPCVDGCGGDSSVTIPTESPLHIVHSAEPEEITVGEDATFTMTVTNRIDEPISDIELGDELAGFEAGSPNGDASADSGEVSEGSITWSGDLDPGESATVTFTATGEAVGTMTTRFVGVSGGTNCPTVESDDEDCWATVTVATAQELPDTGAGTGPLVAVGLAALLLGGLGIGGSRLRTVTRR